MLVVFTETNSPAYHHCQVVVTEALQDRLSPQMAEHLFDQAMREHSEGMSDSQTALWLGLLDGLKALDDYLTNLPTLNSLPTITFTNPRETATPFPTGLDAFRHEAHRGNYEPLEINEAPYPVAWKALPSGQRTAVLAQVDENVSFPPGVVFKQNDNVIPTQPAAQMHQQQIDAYRADE